MKEFDLEEVDDEKIAPLVTQIIEICKLPSFFNARNLG